MSDNPDTALALALTTALNEFEAIDNPSISDVSDLATSLGDIIEDVVADDGVNHVSMVSAVRVLLDVFSAEGMTDEEYEAFYEDLSDDITEDALISDIQHIIYSYLINMSHTSHAGDAFVDSTTLPLGYEFSNMLYQILLVLVAGADSGLTDKQKQQAELLVMMEASNMSVGYTQDQVSALWSLILQSFSSTGVSSSLSDQIDVHFSALLTMVRNLNYSSFVTGAYDKNFFQSAVQGFSSTQEEAVELFDFYIGQNQQSSEDGTASAVLGIMWTLSSKISDITDAAIDSLDEASEEDLIASTTVDFITDSYYVLVALISLISALTALVVAEGSPPTTKFISAIKTNTGNISRLKNNIDGLGTYIKNDELESYVIDPDDYLNDFYGVDSDDFYVTDSDDLSESS